MAKSQLQLIELYQEALHSVVASPENWLEFWKVQDEITAIHSRISL